MYSICLFANVAGVKESKTDITTGVFEFLSAEYAGLFYSTSINVGDHSKFPELPFGSVRCLSDYVKATVASLPTVKTTFILSSPAKNRTNDT